MELKELVMIIRRWAWLMAVGLVIGLLAGYLVSVFMQPVYESSTKLMISREIQEVNPDFAGLNSQQLVETYIQILKTKPLLDTTIAQAGVEVESSQVSVEQVPDTQIIKILVQDQSPIDAASVANTMVQVLIEQNESMQAGQYDALESRLTQQIEQVQAQIDIMQNEYEQTLDTDYQDQLRLVEEQINEIQAEISTLQVEIDSLAPAYRQADRVLLAEKQTRVEQLQSMFVTYEEMRANLLILGKPLQSSKLEYSPHLQQLQSNLNLYQNLYLTLAEELERARLSRLRQTPNIVHIEEASIPEKPVRPNTILYTSLSGAVGLMLAIGLAFFKGISRTDQEIPDKVVQAVPEKKQRKVKPSERIN